MARPGFNQTKYPFCFSLIVALFAKMHGD